MIHESRFIYKNDGLWCIDDLGEYWVKKTGFPIPLGVLMLKKENLESQEFSQYVLKSIQWANKNFEEALALCLNYAQEMNASVCRSHIKLYVNEFSKDMGKAGKAAIDFLTQKIV